MKLHDVSAKDEEPGSAELGRTQVDVYIEHVHAQVDRRDIDLQSALNTASAVRATSTQQRGRAHGGNTAKRDMGETT